MVNMYAKFDEDAHNRLVFIKDQGEIVTDIRDRRTYGLTEPHPPRNALPGDDILQIDTCML